MVQTHHAHCYVHTDVERMVTYLAPQYHYVPSTTDHSKDQNPEIVQTNGTNDSSVNNPQYDSD